MCFFLILLVPFQLIGLVIKYLNQLVSSEQSACIILTTKQIKANFNQKKNFLQSH